MAKAGGQTRGWIGWALGLLAALTLVLATPQHVLDFDEASGPAAAVAVHGHARTLIDHGQPGHDCAGHCAAHVMSHATAPPAVLAPPAHRPLVWTASLDRTGRTRPPFRLDRPPEA